MSMPVSATRYAVNTRRAGRMPKAEVPGDRREGEGGSEFDERIADGDRRAAGGAAAARGAAS